MVFSDSPTVESGRTFLTLTLSSTVHPQTRGRLRRSLPVVSVPVTGRSYAPSRAWLILRTITAPVGGQLADIVPPS